MIFAYQKPLEGTNVGIVFGSFAPLHQGHLDLIMQAKKENDGGCIVIVCGFDGDKGEPLMPLSKRYRYVREFFADDDLVAVYGINDTELGLERYPDGWEGWLEEFENNIWPIAVAFPNEQHGKWYVGDKNYYIDLTERFDKDAVLVDRLATNPICATMIRNNPIAHWNKITYPFRRVFSTNILICGTASEGKTTLTQDLGKYFNAPYSHEWARDYMRESCIADWELTGTDFMAFLQGQYNLNKQRINSRGNNGLFFSDTDALVTRMYAEMYAKDSKFDLTMEEFEKIAVLADEIDRKSKWDKIYLLCPKGKFVDDHERYMGHADMDERHKLFEILCNNIKRAGKWDKVVILSGGYWENFRTIVEDVKGMMEDEKY